VTTDRGRYRKARNKASAAVEAGYRDHLNIILGNVVSDPRAFYRFIGLQMIRAKYDLCMCAKHP